MVGTRPASGDDSQQPKREELRIVLVGKTGGGKSATANTILGRKAFDSKNSLTSVTKECKNDSASLDDTRDILVVDTPGLFDTKVPLNKTSKEIGRCILYSSPGPHAILIVIQMGRFTDEEKNTVERIQGIFGDDAVKYIILLFTHAQKLENSELLGQLQELNDTYISELLIKCKNRVCVFENEAPKAEQEAQVTELIKIIDEMVSENGGSYYTNEMYEEAEKKIQAKMEELQKKYREEEEKKKKEMESIIKEQIKMRQDKFMKEREQEQIEALRKEKEALEQEIKKKLEEIEQEKAKQERARAEMLLKEREQEQKEALRKEKEALEQEVKKKLEEIEQEKAKQERARAEMLLKEREQEQKEALRKEKEALEQEIKKKLEEIEQEKAKQERARAEMLLKEREQEQKEALHKKEALEQELKKKLEEIEQEKAKQERARAEMLLKEREQEQKEALHKEKEALEQELKKKLEEIEQQYRAKRERVRDEAKNDSSILTWIGESVSGLFTTMKEWLGW